ncbi:MAG: sugar ABC transporter substrate-binding protein [Candidatus Omnitrophota bacterium]
MRPALRLVKILTVILLLASGCAQQKSTSKKIVIWHWMNDRKPAFETLSKQYKEKTGIDVEFKLFFPPDIYSQKVIAAARAGNLPEIFGILGEKRTVGSFVKAGYILDLTPYMEAGNNAWKDSFYNQALEVTIFKPGNTYGVTPGIYGVPIDTTLIEFIYNKKLFSDAGIDPNQPPKTLAEFIAYAKKIKASQKVNGFVCGWGEGWLLDCLATEWAINLMGEEKFFKTIQGTVPYTDKDWITVFSLFAELRDAGILSPNITTMINKEAEDQFSKGQAAFSFNGSWTVNVYKQLGPDLNYGFFPLPKISEKFPAKIWGGAGAAFIVNSHSPNKEEAVKLLQWLTEKPQQEFLIKETNNLPAIRNCDENIPTVLKPLLKDLTILTHPNIWPYNEDSRVIEVIDKGLQQIVMGIKTPEEVAHEIQAVKKRVLAK